MVLKNVHVWGQGVTDLAIANGKFAQVGGDIAGDETWTGKWILPGFIDAHCHILPTGLDLQKLHLGDCQSPEDVLDKVAARDRELGDGDWLMAVHYDQTKFPGAEHLTRHQLDAVTTRPTILRHVNGHASVANSTALIHAGITNETKDPDGGTFVRDASGELTGVLLERAHEEVTSSAPSPTLEQMVDAIMAASQEMAKFGITNATDMMTGRFDLDLELQAYRIASEKNCPIRLRMYLQWAPVLGSRRIDPARLRELIAAMNPDKCEVLGLKVFADGAIGSATAAIHGKFLTTGGNGQLIYREDRLAKIIADIDAGGWRCATHTIGDRSTDLVMDAYEKSSDPRRHRIEHIMIMSDQQIERLAKLGTHATMQPEFLHAFGHAYRAQLGDDVAAKLKRVRSVLDAGIPLSFNSDRPIVLGNPWVGINAAVNRPSGFDPAEAVTLKEAVDLYTQGGAKANFEEHRTGSIEVGQFADFQVYDDEPLPGSSPSAVFMGGVRTV
ncbi:amidohydrolase [Kamptonema cortianum]|nr:amidohydrolase [Geitlerinema splendidum]MDK3158585.1 amidohydrolase [Kamptonema cortianum]